LKIKRFYDMHVCPEYKLIQEGTGAFAGTKQIFISGNGLFRAAPPFAGKSGV